jgi:very-short-patch-repair endonuclease
VSNLPLWPEDSNDDSAARKRRGAKPGNKNALGYRHTEQTRRRLSELNKGRKHTDKHRQALVEANKARAGKPRKPFTDEHRRHLSESKKAKWTDPIWREKQRLLIRANFEQPEAMEKMRNGVRAHWGTLTHEQRIERITPSLLAMLTASPTSIELAIREVLTGWQLKFEEQRQVGPYFVDFLLPNRSIVVEALGCHWHGCLECGHDTEADQKRRGKDRRRAAYLRKCGYTVIFVWEHDIRRDAEATLRSAFENVQTQTLELAP